MTARLRSTSYACITGIHPLFVDYGYVQWTYPNSNLFVVILPLSSHLVAMERAGAPLLSFVQQQPGRRYGLHNLLNTSRNKTAIAIAISMGKIRSQQFEILSPRPTHWVGGKRGGKRGAHHDPIVLTIVGDSIALDEHMSHVHSATYNGVLLSGCLQEFFI
eukprot:scaffold77003_cov33-Tisochrysis_lutea.AAC.3